MIYKQNTKSMVNVNAEKYLILGMPLTHPLLKAYGNEGN